MNGVSAAERLALTKIGYERKDGGANRNLRQLLPIPGKGELKLLELGGL
jgi:hypothetical protein